MNRFSSRSRFEKRSPLRPAQEIELDRLKNRLLRKLLDETEHPAMSVTLRRVANEAAALAWLTPYPLLVLPSLLEEKAETAFVRAKQQQIVRQRSQAIIPESA